MSNPATYAPNTSLNTGTASPMSDPLVASSNASSNGGGATYATGQVVSGYSSGIHKTDPVAVPYGASTGVTYAYPNHPNTMYVGGGAPPAFQTVYVGNQTHPGFGHSAPLQAAPQGRWKDGLFDCCSNLWPSCGCLFIFSGVWLVAQMAEKTQMQSFRNIVNAYFGMYILCFFVSLFLGGWVMLIPFLLVWGLSIKLRLHASGYYNIRANTCQEFFTALICPCFSVPQIARHIYGYTKVYDGDSDPFVADYYPGSNRFVAPGSGQPGDGALGSNNQQMEMRNQNAMTV